ncbi:hypothetical protein [Shimia sp. SDUM112013]|uniref:hypothetical protein n=1 Tax=Shimia sp. SDUM112013 TaxID=3136160 RepID=UPI0032EC8330
MKHFAMLGLIAIALMATPAMAGNTGMKDAAGNKLRIGCKSAGCTVQAKAKGGKWKTVEQTEGGSDNFKALVTKYKGQGYK